MSIKNLSIILCLFMSLSVIKKILLLMDLLTRKARKKNYPLHSVGISLGKLVI